MAAKITRIYDPENDQSNCLNAIGDAKTTRRLVASFYVDCIRAGTGVDWHAINTAIIKKFGGNGLIDVKKMAWKEIGGVDV